MNAEDKKKEPQLRTIKAPKHYRRESTNIETKQAWSGGFGLSEDDCMNYDIFLTLCRNNALKSKVYVCGSGELTPNDCPYSSSGSSSSSSSSSSGSTGTSGSGEEEDIFITGERGDWYSWSEWGNWSGTNGSGWDNPGSVPDDIKREMIENVQKAVDEIFSESFNIVYTEEAFNEGILACAHIQNKEIWVNKHFFECGFNDQLSIIWHEYYILTHDYYPITGSVNVPSNYKLKPDDTLLDCLKRAISYRLDKNTYEENLVLEYYMLTSELIVSSKLNKPQWYRREIEAYKAEMKNGKDKSDRYKCEVRWTLWKYECLLYLAEKYEK